MHRTLPNKNIFLMHPGVGEKSEKGCTRITSKYNIKYLLNILQVPKNSTGLLLLSEALQQCFDK